MRASLSRALFCAALAIAMLPEAGRTESYRDFVFDDEFGHLIIRFAGTTSVELSPSQAYEISNAEFSNMVHDRLHADLAFGVEPADEAWAQTIEPQIIAHAERLDLDFGALHVECRIATCRLVMEQSGTWSTTEHQAILQRVQDSFDQFLAERTQEFETEFMLTAFYQDFESSHIRVFLRRAGYSETGLVGL